MMTSKFLFCTLCLLLNIVAFCQDMSLAKIEMKMKQMNHSRFRFVQNPGISTWKVWYDYPNKQLYLKLPIYIPGLIFEEYNRDSIFTTTLYKNNGEIIVLDGNKHDLCMHKPMVFVQLGGHTVYLCELHITYCEATNEVKLQQSLWDNPNKQE